MIDLDFIKEELMAGERMTPSQSMELINKLLEVRTWVKEKYERSGNSAYNAGYDSAQFDVACILGCKDEF